MNADDEFPIPITTQPEDLFDDLRAQTEAMRLAEGLLRYTSLPVALSDERAADDPALITD